MNSEKFMERIAWKWRENIEYCKNNSSNEIEEIGKTELDGDYFSVEVYILLNNKKLDKNDIHVSFK